MFGMTNPETALFMMCIFLFFVLLGFPIAFTLLAMGVAFGYFAYWNPENMESIFDNRIFDLVVQNTYSVMDNHVLTAVPLFLFMGYLVERAGIVAKLFFAIRLASHRLPASMAVAALITCALFSTATGIIGAVVTLMGLLAWPAMIKAGYDKKICIRSNLFRWMSWYFNTTKYYVDCICSYCSTITIKTFCSSDVTRFVVSWLIYLLCDWFSNVEATFSS